MTSYYDMILGLIPLTLLGVGGTLVVLGVQLAVAIPVAASLSVGLICHALFVNQPGSPVTQPSAPSQPTQSTE